MQIKGCNEYSLHEIKNSYSYPHLHAFLFKTEILIFGNNDITYKFEGGSKGNYNITHQKKILGVINTYLVYFSLIIFIELLESSAIDSNMGSAVSWPQVTQNLQKGDWQVPS